MQNSRKGFTLAEVLVTLAIIGVVAALTIPTLISSTNASKFTTALKKNLSTLNSVVQTNLANNDMAANDASIVDATDLAAWFVAGDATAVAGTDAPTNLNVLRWVAADPTSAWLTDGTRLTFYKTTGVTGGCIDDTADAFTPTGVAEICYVIVDTNGDKKPNSIATAAAPADVYVLGITPNAVIPVTTNADTADISGLLNVNGGALDPDYSGAIPSGNNASYSAMTGAT